MKYVGRSIRPQLCFSGSFLSTGRHLTARSTSRSVHLGHHSFMSSRILEVYCVKPVSQSCMRTVLLMRPDQRIEQYLRDIALGTTNPGTTNPGNSSVNGPRQAPHNALIDLADRNSLCQALIDQACSPITAPGGRNFYYHQMRFLAACHESLAPLATCVDWDPRSLSSRL